MKKTLREIAQIVGGEVVGDENVVVTGVCGIREAKEGDLTFVANAKYIPLMRQTRASAIITSRDVKQAPKPIIRTENPDLAFAKMISLLAPNEITHPRGVHPTAIIGKEVKLGEDVAIQPYVVIGDRAVIGDRTVLYAGVFVGDHVKIGADALIYPHVAIRERVEIGNRVIVHSGTVIGSDGFGFSTVKGVHVKIPQIGTVKIEDDVEIGANVTIDRARFGVTHIKQGTKIDNLVQIAHNAVIGEHSIIVAQAGISGSTVIGKGVVLAGQAGVVGHITIGDNAIIGARSGVTKSVPPNTVVLGAPAKPISKFKETNACLQRLPKLYETVRLLEEKVAALTKNARKRSSKNNSKRSQS
ncbi:MAG: UDP-3-O-(3-hydroxymyristoyl)glucosamine N-acyltransferase [Candidatus Omnitrophica bacterium]|nr:UDP-3-O-(3-hydroxymyristoyl)glucosamine N-acyltransferase [Candidatus Omnitrophota bacterium]